jgi:hypothetical protein
MEILINNARLSYPHLFKASAFAPGQEEKFSATFLLNKDDKQMLAIQKAMLEAAEAKWPNKGQKMLDSFDNRNKAVKDGDKIRPDDNVYEGKIAISASNKSRPLVVDKKRISLTEEDGVIYAGCRVNAKIRFFAYDNVSKGISASLLGVQFAGDDSPLGGVSTASVDDFDDLDDDL